MRGTVAWFKRSFGFISPDGGGADIFVHHTGIVSPEKFKTLNGGDRVEFSVDRRIEDNRQIAVNVRKVEEGHGK